MSTGTESESEIYWNEPVFPGHKCNFTYTTGHNYVRPSGRAKSGTFVMVVSPPVHCQADDEIGSHAHDHVLMCNSVTHCVASYQNRFESLTG